MLRAYINRWVEAALIARPSSHYQSCIYPYAYTHHQTRIMGRPYPTRPSPFGPCIHLRRHSSCALLISLHASTHHYFHSFVYLSCPHTYTRIRPRLLAFTHPFMPSTKHPLMQSFTHPLSFRLAIHPSELIPQPNLCFLLFIHSTTPPEHTE